MTTPAESGRNGWRAAIERGFERWGRLVVDHRWVALGVTVLATGWLLSFLPQLEVDNSTESMLTPDDPAVVAYNDFRAQFGRDDKILLAVTGGDVFDPAFVARLRDVHDAIESEVDLVTEVESLINARFTRGEGGDLVVGELLEDWPASDADWARFEERVRSNPLYLDTLVSRDFGATVIAVTPETYSQLSGGLADLAGFDESGSFEGEAASATPKFLTAAEGDQVVEQLYAIMDRFEAPDFRLHMAGAIPMTWRINQGMMRDMGVFLPVTLGLMAVILGLLFRRVGGVVLPLMVVGLSLGAAIGVMIVFGIPGSTAVQILPVFLLTVGVCDAVHILAIVYRLRMEGLSKEDAIPRALAHSGLAVLMTSVTTAAGMVSFVTSEMASIQHLGILAPIGVFLAFGYTMVLLPSLLAIFPLPAPRTGRIATEGLFPFERPLVATGLFAARHPWRVMIPATLLIVLAVMGAMQITFSHNGLGWFDPDDRTRVDVETIDRTLGGSVTMDLLVDTGEVGGLYDPALLRDLARVGVDIQRVAQEPVRVAKSVSIRDIVEETHQALNENRPEMRRIPEERALVAQELLLFEQSGSDDTEEFVDAEYRMTRLNMRVPFVDALLFPPFLRDVEQIVAKRLGDDVEFRITGIMVLLAEIFEQVLVSMARSYAFAIAVITPLMMLLLGSLRRGLVSMVPNLLPIVAVLAVMGWGRIPIDSTTMLIGAMVIGIAVDDTIHFMHKFHRYFEDTGDLERAVSETLRTTGSALLFTTLVLVVGFAVFGLGEMTNVRIFGGLASFAAAVALLADLLIAPALLALVERSRRSPATTAAAAAALVSESTPDR